MVGIFEHYVGSGDPPWCTPGHTCNMNDNKPRNTRTRHPLECCEESQKYVLNSRRSRTIRLHWSVPGPSLVTKINISDKSCLVQEYQTRASGPARFTYLYGKCTCSTNDSSSEQWITAFLQDVIYYFRNTRLSFLIFSQWIF